MKGYWFIIAWILGSFGFGFLINITNAQWMHWLIVILIIAWGIFLFVLHEKTE